MADNSSVPVASGNETFANKDIAGVKYPRHIPVTPAGVDIDESAVFGSLTETAPTTDTASSGLNGRLQRIAQRITSLIALLPTALGAGGGLKVDGSGTALPVSQSGSWALSAGAAVIGAVTHSGSWVLSAGAAIIGKVGIDQTTDGTTNKVAADLRLAGTAVDKGAGTGGSATPRVIIDSSQFSSLGATTKSASTSVARATDETLGFTVTQAASSTVTRPADTTPYASGDLVANSTTAVSVANLQFTTLARVSGGSGVIVGAQIQKSTNTVTNAAFRLHLFNTAPTYTSAGDNSALSTVVVASAKGYLGYIDITAMVGFSDVAHGSGAPDNSRGGIPYVATAQIIYGLLEARGAYTPGNAEVFTVTLDALQD